MKNLVILIGRVGKDPEVRDTSSSKVSSFTLATSEKYTDKKGEKIENTEWHNIVIWGNLSKVVEQYVKKGNLVYLEGKIKTRSYDDKEGNKRYITEIVCHTLNLLGKNENN